MEYLCLLRYSSRSVVIENSHEKMGSYRSTEHAFYSFKMQTTLKRGFSQPRLTSSNHALPYGPSHSSPPFCSCCSLSSTSKPMVILDTSPPVNSSPSKRDTSSTTWHLFSSSAASPRNALSRSPASAARLLQRDTVMSGKNNHPLMVVAPPEAPRCHGVCIMYNTNYSRCNGAIYRWCSLVLES